MTSNNFVFQQTTNSRGKFEFRVKFGRNKSFVFRKHERFYYLDLYDNRLGRVKSGIYIGLDELDFLRGNLDTLLNCFNPVVSINFILL